MFIKCPGEIGLLDFAFMNKIHQPMKNWKRLKDCAAFNFSESPLLAFINQKESNDPFVYETEKHKAFQLYHSYDTKMMHGDIFLEC